MVQTENLRNSQEQGAGAIMKTIAVTFVYNHRAVTVYNVPGNATPEQLNEMFMALLPFMEDDSLEGKPYTTGPIESLDGIELEDDETDRERDSNPGWEPW